MARKQAFLQIGNLNAAYQRLAQEPKSKQKNIGIIYDLITICNTYLSSLTSLGMFIRTNKTGNVPENFEIFVKHIAVNLENAIAILNNNESKNSLANEDLEMATKNYEEYFHKISVQRTKEIEKGIPVSNDMRVQLRETQLVFEQVRWLINLSENLVKKVKNV